MTTDFRPLTDQEQRALERLLAVEFPGRQGLEPQVRSLAVRQRDETLFEFASLSEPRTALPRRTYGVPIEGTYLDRDGAQVFLFLFTDEQGALVELEVWKPDGTALLTSFSDAEFSVRAIDAKLADR